MSDRTVIVTEGAPRPFAGAPYNQAIKAAGLIFCAAGTSLDRVVKTTVFVADMGDFATVNSVYGTYFPEQPPARSTVQVAGLPAGAAVEIEAIALA